MKKKLFALSGVFLIVLVVTGLWATRATDLMGVIGVEPNEPQSTSRGDAMTMQEMTEGAELIFIGKCLETRSQWNQRTLITLATVSVVEILKGAAPPTVTVALPGGIDSQRRFPVAMTYAGAPTMASGEDLVLFLNPNGEVENSYSVVGFAQGKFSIARDNAGEQFVTRDATIAPIEMTRGNPLAVRLAEFKERVRAHVR